MYTFKINFNNFNPIHVTCLFLYPLETSENKKFSDVFRGFRKRPMIWNKIKTYQTDNTQNADIHTNVVNDF